MSQFEKSMADLAIDVIHANSPQAKGRVERLFRTLQDRLVRELRLAGISSVEKANEFLTTYLPKYNRRFKRQAASVADLHRPAPHSRELDRILCIRDERTVRNDFTIAHNGALYQIAEPTRAQKVMVEERLDGTLHITYKGHELNYREIPARSPKEIFKTGLTVQKKKGCIPPADHPWRTLSKRNRGVKEQLPVALKSGHFYFGKNRTFLFWLDTVENAPLRNSLIYSTLSPLGGSSAVSLSKSHLPWYKSGIYF